MSPIEYCVTGTLSPEVGHHHAGIPQRFLGGRLGFYGFSISYLFSIVNFINVNIIHDMNLFLSKVISSGNIKILPSFKSYVLNQLVPKHRFRGGYFWSVYLNMIAFIFTTILKFPSVDLDTESAGYMDVVPHTWLAPILIAYVWLIICLIIFLDCSCLPRWWLPPLAIVIFSLFVGLVKGIRFRLKKG